MNRPADAARAAPDAPAWVGLRRLLRDIGEETRAVLLRLSPGAGAHQGLVVRGLRACGLRPLDGAWTDWNLPRRVMRLALGGDESALLRRMAKRRRRRLLTTGDVDVDLTDSLDGVRTFYGLLVAHARDRRYPIRAWPHFATLHRYFTPTGRLIVVLGRVGGAVVSATASSGSPKKPLSPASTPWAATLHHTLHPPPLSHPA